jgi:hypothetical protein
MPPRQLLNASSSWGQGEPSDAQLRGPTWTT